MTIQEFIDKHNIKMTSIKVNQNPYSNSDWDKKAKHYEVTFTQVVERKERQFSTYYSMGSAHTKPPKAKDVLDCLILDYEANNYSFNEWCNDLGYDNDSILALKIYNTCKEISTKMKNFFTSSQLNELMECERE